MPGGTYLFKFLNESSNVQIVNISVKTNFANIKDTKIASILNKIDVILLSLLITMSTFRTN